MRRDSSETVGPPVLWGGLSMVGCLLVGLTGTAGVLGAVLMLLAVVIIRGGGVP